MAEITPSEANVSAVAALEEALAQPEPMCLAMLEIHPPAGAVAASGQGGDTADGSPTDQVMEEAYQRLRDTLRDYDHLTRLDSSRFILVMRTLADASILDGRMNSLYELMTRPYAISRNSDQATGEGHYDHCLEDHEDHHEVRAEVFLGAAVRMPQETSAQLVGRVDQAVILARSASVGGPVML